MNDNRRSRRRLAERFRLWRDYRATLAELSELSPHELSDIGLDRSQISAAARQAVYGR